MVRNSLKKRILMLKRHSLILELIPMGSRLKVTSKKIKN